MRRRIEAPIIKTSLVIALIATIVLSVLLVKAHSLSCHWYHVAFEIIGIFVSIAAVSSYVLDIIDDFIHFTQKKSHK